MKNKNWLCLLALIALLPAVLSCSLAIWGRPLISRARPHWSDVTKVLVDVRASEMTSASKTAIIDLTTRTIEPYTEPEAIPAVPIINMPALLQNNTWQLSSVNDTLIVTSWVLDEDPAAISMGPVYKKVITCVGTLPSLANVNQIGVFYSNNLKALFVWYRNTLGDDSIARSILGDVCIDPSPATLIPKPAVSGVYYFDYFKPDGPNKVYDNDGYYYMWYGMVGATCIPAFWIPITANGFLGNPPYASSKMESYPDNRAGAKWFVGIGYNDISVSSFDGTSTYSFAIPEANLTRILNNTIIDDGNKQQPDTKSFLQTTSGQATIGVGAGVGLVLIAAIACIVRRRRATANTEAVKSPVNSNSTIVVRTTERQGSDSALNASPSQVTYSQL